jgi:hypothetical protein
VLAIKTDDAEQLSIQESQKCIMQNNSLANNKKLKKWTKVDIPQMHTSSVKMDREKSLTLARVGIDPYTFYSAVRDANDCANWFSSSCFIASTTMIQNS